MGRGGSQESIGVPRAAALIVIAIALCAAVLVAAWADWSRSGRFPHQPGDLTRSCCTRPSTLVGLAPADQLARVPLAGFPLLQGGLEAAGSNDRQRARTLIAAAVRRDPKLIPARAWLADDAARDNRLADAVGQLDWLYSLSTPLRPRLIEALGSIAARPGGVAALKGYARRAPIWQPAFIGQLVKAKVDPRITYALIAPGTKSAGSAGRAGSAGDAGQEATLIGGMVAKGDIEGAYLTWLAQLPAGAMDDVGYVYDQAFRGLPGVAPFNWSLIDSDAATTDLMNGGGVRISYFGDGPVTAIAQLTVLPPGRYIFTIVARSLGDIDGNGMSASITCGPPGSSPLATIPIKVSDVFVRQSARIAVPEGCQAQTIAFAGAPAEYPKAAEFRIKSVSITGDRTS